MTYIQINDDDGWMNGQTESRTDSQNALREAEKTPTIYIIHRPDKKTKNKTVKEVLNFNS